MTEQGMSQAVHRIIFWFSKTVPGVMISGEG